MAKVIYTALASLDGYVADESGKFDWAEPDEEVHTFINELARPAGIHLYGTVSTARTRVERDFDAEAVRRMKVRAASDITVGGPDLASHAFRAGLVDECHLFLAPIVVGGGTRALPAKVRFGLELLDERRFSNGVASLRYRVRT